MSKIVVVQYETRPEAAADNQRLIEGVYAELAREEPGGLRYLTLRLADGVRFLHCAITEEDALNPLTRSAAFAEFTRDIGRRCVEPPRQTEASIVGSYRAV